MPTRAHLPSRRPPRRRTPMRRFDQPELIGPRPARIAACDDSDHRRSVTGTIRLMRRTSVDEEDAMSNPTEGPRAGSVRRYGWVPDVPDHRDVLFSPPPAVMASLPPHADLRAACPEIYDQGQLGSCTANAIGAAFEFDQKKQGLADFMQ